jgi:hypothetical protein
MMASSSAGASGRRNRSGGGGSIAIVAKSAEVLGASYGREALRSS